MYSSELIRGTLKTLVLKVLDKHHRMYGYQLSKEVKERTGDRIILTEGALYPTLHKLRQEGLVTVEEERIGKRIRKYYKLTPIGKRKAIERTSELLDFIQTLSRFMRSKPVIHYEAG